MTKKLAVLIITILILLGIFQILLIAGLPYGNFAWGGVNEILPPIYRAGSMFALFIYIFIGLIILQKAGFIKLFKSKKFVDVSIWVIGVYFCIGALLNIASPSYKEKFVMTPIVIILAISTILIALKSKN